jgi:hypothetical protein
MRRGFVAFFVLSLVGAGLTGCGLFRFEQREPWRTQAEEACMSARLVQPNAYMALASKIDGPGSCGMDYPFKVSAFSAGSVGLTSKVTLACPIIPSIDGWLEGTVKPAALLYFGVPLLDIRAGSYACRPRNNLSGAKTSEHAFGNAFDVMAFILADGRQITVVKGWRGEPAEQEFLREVFTGACQTFSTVLGPGSDPFHYDHIHLDLARHDPRGTRRICQPVLKFEPRLDPRGAMRQVQARAPDRIEPRDVDDDGATRPDMPRAAQGGYAADLPARGDLPMRGELPARGGPPAAPARPTAQTYRPLATAGVPPGPQPLVLSPQGIY